MGDSSLPSLFLKYGPNGKQTVDGAFVVLAERETTLLLGEFALVAEAGYITCTEGEWVFQAATDSKVDRPPFRRVFAVNKQAMVRNLRSHEDFFHGHAVREAWQNWSEAETFHLRIESDTREFVADTHRLTEYQAPY